MAATPSDATVTGRAEREATKGLRSVPSCRGCEGPPIASLDELTDPEASWCERCEPLSLGGQVLAARAQVRRLAIDAAGFPTDTGWGQVIDQTYDERTPLWAADPDHAVRAVRSFALDVWGITPETVRRWRVRPRHCGASV